MTATVQRSNSLQAMLTSVRADPSRVVLEGFHALKHALRFGAEIELAGAADKAAMLSLAERLAPDLTVRLDALLVEDSRYGDGIAVARRPGVDVAAMLDGGGRIVLLERPTHLGNLGAVIRVAAAASAAGVLTTGPADPWHPQALRGAAGLHFALSVARIAALPETGRLLVALDPDGADLRGVRIPGDAILAFGSEREGLSDALLARAGMRLAIPMRAGVSSLNLATSVAVALYGLP